MFDYFNQNTNEIYILKNYMYEKAIISKMYQSETTKFDPQPPVDNITKTQLETVVYIKNALLLRIY